MEPQQLEMCQRYILLSSSTFSAEVRMVCERASLRMPSGTSEVRVMPFACSAHTCAQAAGAGELAALHWLCICSVLWDGELLWPASATWQCWNGPATDRNLVRQQPAEPDSVHCLTHPELL